MEDDLKIQQYTLQLLEENDINFHSFSEFRNFIIEKINNWINNDFEHLLYLLYRIDVHEDKVRKLMIEHKGENAAEIITDLIIARQKQKIEIEKALDFLTIIGIYNGEFLFPLCGAGATKGASVSTISISKGVAFISSS